MGYIVPLLFFYIDGFGIKLHMKVKMPLNKKKKNLLVYTYWQYRIYKWSSMGYSPGGPTLEALLVLGLW